MIKTLILNTPSHHAAKEEEEIFEKNASFTFSGIAMLSVPILDLFYYFSQQQQLLE
jgi:hypothetical protein